MSAKVIEFIKIEDDRGNLTFIESNSEIPFQIKRTYWIYDVPSGMQRGGHAFIEQEEVIVALSGSFDVLIHDGREEKMFQLNRSNYGLYVPKGVWRQMQNFSTNSLALVLSSTSYNGKDYIRNFSRFLKMKENEKL